MRDTGSKPTSCSTSARRSRPRASRKSIHGMGGLLARQRRGTRTVRPLAAVPETLLVESLAFAEHVVDRPAQPRRQDRQRLAFATLRRLFLLPALGPLAAAQEQARRLGECPAQMG